MTLTEPGRAAARPARPTRLLASWNPSAPTMGITIFGCAPDEAALFRATAPRFGVVPTIVEAPVSDANAALAAGNRCISVGHKTPVTAAALRALKRAGVGYVSTRSIGDNHIDVSCATTLGIAVGNVAYSPDSVADYTLMLILMALRHAPSVLRHTDRHDYRLLGTRGRELRDLTVGVVGTGRIGSAVIDRLRGFGCRVLATDHRPKTAADYVSLDELLRRSDIVTLHTPLTPETHHLLDRRRIAGLKQGAILVNTGRGALIETEALIAALEGGRLGGAALDVLEGEDGIFYRDWSQRPMTSEALMRLHALPNVIVSPHTAFYTDHALRDIVEHSIVNCLAFERGEQPWIG